jgi:hypothetical protein
MVAPARQPFAGGSRMEPHLTIYVRLIISRVSKDRFEGWQMAINGSVVRGERFETERFRVGAAAAARLKLSAVRVSRTRAPRIRALVCHVYAMPMSLETIMMV